MVIIGAKGHAKELLSILQETELPDMLVFFDNITYFKEDNPTFLGFSILTCENLMQDIFEDDKRFHVGIGVPNRRSELTKKFISLGGKPFSIISNKAVIGETAQLGIGINVMPFSSVFNDSVIGKGVLINSYASVHHDAKVGDYCELSPGSKILGYSSIGNLCSIGTNAVVLPNVSVTDNVIIGAGSVVTKDIKQPGIYVGVPAKRISS